MSTESDADVRRLVGVRAEQERLDTITALEAMQRGEKLALDVQITGTRGDTRFTAQATAVIHPDAAPNPADNDYPRNRSERRAALRRGRR